MQQLISDESWAQIVVDEEASRITVTWKGFALTEELQRTLTQATGLIRQHRTSTYLADCRLRRAVPPDGQAWMVEAWFPKVLRSGILHRMAIVLPERSIARTNMGSIIGQVSGRNFASRSFEEFDAAVAWLDEELPGPGNPVDATPTPGH
ncbi:MAG: hypothetical protein NVSMB16_01340 [Acidimicrobiales bacterium]